MCGIFAVAGSKSAATDIHVGLQHLQHRGQDAAGIFTCSRDSEYSVKNRGLVSDVFTKADISGLKGNIGIGHARYPTAGTCDVNEVQPFAVKNLSFAFNGNVVNYPILKKELQSVISTHSDGEVMLKLFEAEYRKDSTNQGIFKAVEVIQNKVIGGYAVVMSIGNSKVLAFKDPNSIRPLMMGRKDGAVAFASESVALSMQGFTEIEDLQAGEAVIVDTKGSIERKILKKDEENPCIFEWVYFSTAESTINKVDVYGFRKKLGYYLGKKIKKEHPDLKPDIIIPVPDTSRTAAHALAHELNIHYEEGLIKNRYVQRTFIMPTQKERDNAVRLKLKPIVSVIKDKKIMVVDDSIVRGTTSKRIVKLLRESGAKEVYFVSTYPPITNPCFYGIDFQRSEELVAAGKTIPEIEKSIDADKLIYMDIAGLENALGSKKMCKACVSDEYPTSLEHAKELTELRRKHQAQVTSVC